LDIRRGLFRLWLIGTGLFALYACLIVAAYTPSDRFDANAFVMDCTDAANNFEASAISEVEVEVKGQRFDGCQVDQLAFRGKWPDYDDLSATQISAKLLKKLGAKMDKPPAPPSPWPTRIQQFLTIMLVPVVVIVLGWLLLWALAGLRRKPTA
jgi:hypothetical protein